MDASHTAPTRPAALAAGIELVSLTKRYEGERGGGCDRSAHRRGQLLLPAGPSGCGKSTTLRMIAGHETVSSGDILMGRATSPSCRPPRAARP
jgi:putative spermidine/putrescine transport system ATP-binding protein